MCSKSSLSKLLFLLCALGLVNACSSKNDDAEAEQRAAEVLQSRQIELSEVTNGDCLDLQKYFETLRGLPADTRARKMTTGFQVRTLKSALPRNFYLSLAAGNFQIEDGNLADLPELMILKQNGCENVVFSAEGHDEVYTVKEAKADSLTLENEWDGGFTVRWKSPLSLEMSTVSIVSQDLCHSGSKAKVTVDQEISWGDDSIFAATLGEKDIDPNYLSVVSEAKGFTFNSLYSNLTPPVFSPEPIPSWPGQPEPDPIDEVDPLPEDPEDMGPGGNSNLSEEVQPVAPSEDRRLVVSRLKELQLGSIRPELTQCY